MSFVIRDLSVHAYSHGQTLWLYRSLEDSLDEICQTGYFDNATDVLSPMDSIIVVTPTGGRMVMVLHSGTDYVAVKTFS